MLRQAGLSDRERAVVHAALIADPTLAGELEAIAAQLRPEACLGFWRALATELPRRARPAGAVLAALERAAAG